jgi:hypothetical protein
LSKILTGTRFRELASVCLQRSHNALSPDSSVDIQKLCDGFGAEVIFRPLLCEGLIGRRQCEEKPWVVAVDSETFSPDAMSDHTHPLANRLRNTIAHELVHILSFHVEELGVDLPESLKGKPLAEIVTALEAETESLSPLMLLPTSSLEDLKHVHSLHGLVKFCLEKRVSPQVLIQRLNLLARTGEALDYPILRNCIIGMCRSNEFRSWPLYYRADRNLLPAFLHDLLDKKLVEISTVFNEWNPKNPLPSYAARLDLGTTRNRSEITRTGRLFVQSGKRFPKLFYVAIS